MTRFARGLAPRPAVPYPSPERLRSFARAYLDAEEMFRRIEERLSVSEGPEMVPVRAALEAAQEHFGTMLADLSEEAVNMRRGSSLRN